MADTGKMLKKFLRQKSVLDALRSHMDASGAVMLQLKESGVLSQDDVDTLQKIGYPEDRNELLQMLIKKQWTDDSFKKFCAVLNDTGELKQLSTILTEKVEVFSKATEKEREDTERKEMNLTTDPTQLKKEATAKTLYSGGDFNGMDIKQQNAIRLKMQEKDDAIEKLKKENEKMRVGLMKLTSENDEMKAKYVEMDKVVQEMIASLSTSSDDNETAAVQNITQTVLQERDKLKVLAAEHVQLTQSNEKLTEELEAIKKAHDGCQKKFDELQTQYFDEKKLAMTKTEEVQKTLVGAQTKRDQLQKQVDGLQGMFGDNIRCLEHDLAKATRELREKRTGYDEAIKERNNTRKEMHEVKERIRKLLFSLGLNNDIGKTGMSLEHARNISYAMRRNANVGKQKKPGLMDADLDNEEMETLSDIFSTVRVANAQRPTPPPSQSSSPHEPRKDNVEQLPEMNHVQATPRKEPGSSVDVVIPCNTTTDETADTATNIQTDGASAVKSKPADIEKRPINVTILDMSEERRSSSAGLVDTKVLVTTVVHQDNTSRPSSARMTRPGSASLAMISRSSPDCVHTGNDVSRNVKCSVCEKSFVVDSNYDGACIFHVDGATKLYEGTALEVYSCCKTRDTLKGCQKSRHQAVHV